MWIQITECVLCHKKLEQDSEELYWYTKMHEFDSKDSGQVSKTKEPFTESYQEMEDRIYESSVKTNGNGAGGVNGADPYAVMAQDRAIRRYLNTR